MSCHLTRTAPWWPCRCWSATAYSSGRNPLNSQLTSISRGRSPIRRLGTRWMAVQLCTPLQSAHHLLHTVLFIYWRAFNKYWSPTVNLIAVTAVLLVSDYITAHSLLADILFSDFRCIILSVILSEVFTSIGWHYWELYEKTKVGVFFWTPCTLVVCLISVLIQ